MESRLLRVSELTLRSSQEERSVSFQHMRMVLLEDCEALRSSSMIFSQLMTTISGAPNMCIAVRSP
jgi:hypothetical protein